MTVQELIDALEQVEDKENTVVYNVSRNAPVLYADYSWCDDRERHIVRIDG